MVLVAPNGKFDTRKSNKMKKKKRQKREKKMLHPDLVNMWRHAAELFAAPDVRCVHVPSPYPRVDWSRVNKRLISHIPDPSPQPVHGVHEDPDFYESKIVREMRPSGHCVPEVKPSLFYRDNPFGTLPGYLTDAGVVHPDSNPEVINGYVWSPSCRQYILHAEFQVDSKRKIVKKKCKPR